VRQRSRNSMVVLVFAPGGREVVGVVGTFAERDRAQDEQERFARRGYRAEVRHLRTGPDVRRDLG
jgi:hypothetical protein